MLHNRKSVSEIHYSLSQLREKWIQDIKTLQKILTTQRPTQQKNTANNDGVKFQARQSQKNPKYLDARTVTENDVIVLINDVASGKYNESDYVPIRISTPGIIQERLFVENLPMVMPVKKIRQALMIDEGAKKGNNLRGHGFSETDIIEIIKKLDEPDFLFSQPSNDRGIAVVDYSSNSDSSVLIIEFDCEINPSYLSGYEGGAYNLAISSFNVDGGIAGLYEYANRNNWIEVFNN